MAYCANCGKEVSSEAVACPNCGHPGPAASRAPIMGGVAAPGGAQLADYGARAGAWILDAIIIAVPSWIVMTIFSVGVARGGGVVVDELGNVVSVDPSFFGGFFATLGILLVLGILYKVLLEGGPKGQTVGKMVTKIAVKDANNGGSIGYGRAFLRWLVAGVLWAVLYIPGIIDLLFPLWDPKRQTIHDKAASSIVVKVA